VTQASQPTIVVYTHPDCAYSAAAKMDYRKRKVEFLEIDVSKQRDKVAELLKLTKGERITPVIVENGQVTIGFKGGY
jgi:glutaredoxin